MRRGSCETSAIQHPSKKVHKSDFMKIIHMRKMALLKKENTQKELLSNMLRTEQCSPDSYQKKKRDLEVWVNEERKEIRRMKHDFQKAYQKTVEIIEETRVAKDQVKRILNRHHKRADYWSDMDSLNSGSSSFMDQSVISLDSRRRIYAPRGEIDLNHSV